MTAKVDDTTTVTCKDAIFIALSERSAQPDGCYLGVACNVEKETKVKSKLEDPLLAVPKMTSSPYLIFQNRSRPMRAPNRMIESLRELGTAAVGD